MNPLGRKLSGLKRRLSFLRPFGGKRAKLEPWLSLSLTLTLWLSFSLSLSAARPKVALVLGGGGAKGGAEVGALKVIEQTGIKPDIIVGTSIGAIVGGLYAAGYTAAELESMFCEQEWLSLLTDRREDLSGEPYTEKNGVTYIFGFPVIDTNSSQFGLLGGGKVETVLDSMLNERGCARFECLPVAFRCVAVELPSAEEVVLSQGSLSRAIRASMAIPGVFKPVVIDNRRLVDGGMMNNLPVDVARDMGADIVIAIDLQQEKPRNKEQSSSPLTSIADFVGLGGIANWVFSRPDITKYNANRQEADIYINPSLPDYEASSFGNENMRRMITIGQKAALEQAPRLRALVSH